MPAGKTAKMVPTPPHMPRQSASVEETGKVPRRDWAALLDWIVKAYLADLLAAGQSHVDVSKLARVADEYRRGEFPGRACSTVPFATAKRQGWMADCRCGCATIGAERCEWTFRSRQDFSFLAPVRIQPRPTLPIHCAGKIASEHETLPEMLFVNSPMRGAGGSFLTCKGLAWLSLAVCSVFKMDLSLEQRKTPC